MKKYIKPSVLEIELDEDLCSIGIGIGSGDANPGIDAGAKRFDDIVDDLDDLEEDDNLMQEEYS